MEITKRQWRMVEFFYPILLSSVLILNYGTIMATAAGEGKTSGGGGGKKTYIVYVKRPDNMQPLSSGRNPLDPYYQTFLPSTISTMSTDGGESSGGAVFHGFGSGGGVGSGGTDQRMVHTYHTVATGFAATLTEEEAKQVASKDGVISAAPEKVYSLHTTRSPDFLGLRQGLGLWDTAKLGAGITIGVLDTGIKPDHPSFGDEGMLPPPLKWKGRCHFPGRHVCNKKLIGAMNLVSDDSTGKRLAVAPSDDEGHGTHTASTAAGNFVKGANVFGNANGTAAGMAPRAHVAAYKVCGVEGCKESDILAGIEAAINDGVDVLSMSIGGGDVEPFHANAVAIGSFSAIRKGVFVSVSAGNSGPDHYTLSNEAPWLLTVGASTIDRKFKASVKIGNGESLEGQSLNQPKSLNSAAMVPLVYGGSSKVNGSNFCDNNTLTSDVVSGKIVACDRGGILGRVMKGVEVKRAGGVGMILMNRKQDGAVTSADAHVLPATHVSYAEGQKLMAYIKSTTSPTASILFEGTVIGDKNAPAVAAFSSRGPSKTSAGILKPDIIGPGVDILAAWPTSIDNSSAVVTFNTASGTSMSCPHLSGVAALLKSAHPEWSPAAVKSAMMTTAYGINTGGKPIPDSTNAPADVFATGSGHINPALAQNPGLIYDLTPEDYIPYLCGLNYSDVQVSIITDEFVKCKQIKPILEAELNYPSFALTIDPKSSAPQTYTRTVTNVGEANSVYTSVVFDPEGTKITVTPNKLTFTQLNQKLKYTITVTATANAATSNKDFSQGYLRWVSDHKHVVRSPISVTFSS
ncbi:subtilisin-like protease [Cannabis sativa]|uniref:subtilisin-like protease n=1 Tax=Cannabis sativa TaxID=3483 RepID=UPI0029C9C905|nr:subtilisin-like protease [Cannabis sativa]